VFLCSCSWVEQQTKAAGGVRPDLPAWAPCSLAHAPHLLSSPFIARSAGPFVSIRRCVYTSACSRVHAPPCLLSCREHLNLVFIGHIDAGKSTLAGQILFTTVRLGHPHMYFHCGTRVSLDQNLHDTKCPLRHMWHSCVAGPKANRYKLPPWHSCRWTKTCMIQRGC